MTRNFLGVVLGVFIFVGLGAVPAQAQLVVNPSQLTFAVPPGQNPSPQLVFVQSSGVAVNVIISGSSQNNWLTYGNVSSNTTPLNFTVGANSSNLAQGIYTGTLTITPTTGGNSFTPVTVNLQLVVSNGPVLVANPSSLTFNQTQTGVIPPSQTVTVSNPGPSTANFTVTTADTWLSVSPTSGGATNGTPATLTVNVNPGQLTQGTYNSTITLTSSNAANSPLTIPVQLTVPSGPVLGVSPSSFLFNAVAGGINPQSQLITVGDLGIGALGFTVSSSTSSGGPWLSVSPSTGQAPPSQQISVNVNVAGLAPGTYTGQVVVASNITAANSPATISVTLALAAEPMIAISPATLSFTGTVGAANPSPQGFTLTNTGGSVLNYSLTPTTTSGGPWLSVMNAGSLQLSGSTSENLPVSVSLAGLAAGTYTGKVTVSSNFATNSPQSVNVNLTVNPGTAVGLSATPSQLTFDAVPGGSPPNIQTIAVATSTNGQTFTATATTNNGGSWLSVSPTSGTTPGNVSVIVNNGSLGVGTYTGTVSVASGTSNPVTVSVTLNVISGRVILVSPPSLTFNASPGTNPAPQTLAFSVFGAGSISYSYSTTVATSTGGNWLSVNPASGSGAANIVASVNTTGLTVGTYQGLITISSSGTTNTPVSVGVTLNLTGQPSLVLGSSTVQMTTAINSTLSQQIALTTTGSSSVNFSLSTSTASGGSWLTASAGSTSTTPANITVTANPSGLVPGSYRGTVVVTSSGAQNSPLTLNVELAVSAPQFSSAGVVGGASFTSATVSPGGIVSLFGTGLSSATAAAQTLPLPTTLNSTQVLVNGSTAAALFFVSATQINFQLPWEVLGQSQVQIVVTSGGIASLAETVTLAPLGPGIFSINSQGTGQGAIQIANASPPTFAAPAGSIPGAAAQPVTRGSYITIYCTGLGAVTPQPADGAAAVSSTVNTTVSVSLGGSVLPNAQFDFAGLAPGFVGLYQINKQIPTTAQTGPAVNLFITAGGVQSNTVTIAVQ